MNINNENETVVPTLCIDSVYCSMGHNATGDS